MLAKIIIGIIVGVICNTVDGWFGKYILKKRNLEIHTSKTEQIILYILSAGIGTAFMIKFTNVIDIVYTFLILMICLLVAEIDLHHRIIPNELILTMLIVKLGVGILVLLNVADTTTFNVKSSLIGLVAGFIVFTIPAAVGKSVGAGDIKLAAAIGFALGIEGLLYSVVLMGGLILLFAMAQKNASLRKMMYEMIPMGPFMAISTVVVMILQ